MCKLTLHSAQLTLSLVQGLILKSPDGDRGASFSVLSGPPRSPSGGAVEVIEGMVVVMGIAMEGVMVGKVVEVVVVGIAVEGEDEGMTAEEVMVEMMEVVTAESPSC